MKWPTTNLTPSPMNLLATETPCFGSDASSPRSTSICCPRMPPALLMSSAACLTPWVSCAPKAALGPVIGAPTPILISACAAPGEPQRQSDRHGLQNSRPARYPPNDFCNSLIAGRLINSNACVLSHKNAAALPFRSAAVFSSVMGWRRRRGAPQVRASLRRPSRRRPRTKIRGRATLADRAAGARARASHRHICSKPILPSAPFFQTYQT